MPNTWNDRIQDGQPSNSSASYPLFMEIEPSIGIQDVRHKYNLVFLVSQLKNENPLSLFILHSMGRCIQVGLNVPADPNAVIVLHSRNLIDIANEELARINIGASGEKISRAFYELVEQKFIGTQYCGYICHISKEGYVRYLELEKQCRSIAGLPEDEEDGEDFPPFRKPLPGPSRPVPPLGNMHRI